MRKRQRTTTCGPSSTSAGTERPPEICTSPSVQVEWERDFIFIRSSDVSSAAVCIAPFLLCPLEGANFRNILDKAVQADQVVKERYNTHCEMIALLCKPENELSAAIPSANPTKTLQGSEVRTPVTRSLCGSHDLVMGLLQPTSLTGAASCSHRHRYL